MLHHVQTDCAGVTEVIDLKTGRLSWIPLWVPSNHASHEKQRTLSGWRQKGMWQKGRADISEEEEDSTHFCWFEDEDTGEEYKKL